MAPLIGNFFRMSCLSVIFVLPVLLILLNKHQFSRQDSMLALVLAITVLLSQLFYHLPRYYASIYPFMLLGIAGLVALDRSSVSDVLRKAAIALVVAVLLLGASLSAVLLANYSGYDVFGPGIGSNEREVYEETADFLASAGSRRIYATNPIFPAMTNNVTSSRMFDTFAVLWLEQKAPDVIMADLIEEGVDHVVVDQWTRLWGYPYSEAVDALVAAVRERGTLVQLIQPASPLAVEIYRLGPAPSTIVNGDLAYWSNYEGMRIPLGWNPILIGGVGDSADIRESGELTYEGARLVVYEDGMTEPGATSTHAGLSRRLAFPRTEVSTVVMPGLNTEALGAEPLGPAIHFLDGKGHSVILGFSEEIEEEQVSVCAECGHVAVIRPAPLHQWSEHTIDVAKYWKLAGWEIPDELTLLVVLSAHAEFPGYYTFHVASVTVDAPAS